jgi:tripartite-type tricarboxylate transporter receptor subunit TctC
MNTLSRALLAACLAFPCAQPGAQSYPSKPVRWIVPAPPGGAFDLLTRALMPPMSASMGQPLVVDNRAAVSGLTGMEAVAKAAPDGYTLLTAGNPQLVFNKHFYAKLPYDPQKDFASVGLISNLIFALYVYESVPARSLKELIAYARANPGKLNYGTGGVGQAFHLAMELLKQRTGADIVHVPYKGNALAIQDFFAGRIEVMLYPPTGQFMAQIKEGKIRALATANDRRLAALPDVPTFEQAGVANLDRDIIGWVGLLVPAGTPGEIVARLNRELGRAAVLPEMAKVYAVMNVEPVQSTPEQMTARMNREIELWGPVIRGLGIALE